MVCAAINCIDNSKSKVTIFKFSHDPKVQKEFLSYERYYVILLERGESIDCLIASLS